MGAGASSLNSRTPVAILAEADEAKKTPEEVIRWILANADFTDMLDLVNLDKCRLYMWQGMKLVKRVDQVRGEVTIDQERYENTRCFKRSRYYVFLMQNVMALALTTWNTPPFKRDTIYRIKPPSGGASRGQRQQSRSRSSRKTRKQKGGEIRERVFREVIEQSVFSSFLLPFFEIESSAKRDIGRSGYGMYQDLPPTWLKSTVSGTPGTFYVHWEMPRRGDMNSSMTLDCTYEIRKPVQREYKSEIQLKRDGEYGGIIMSLGATGNRKEIARIFPSVRLVSSSFSFVIASDPGTRRNDIKALFNEIHNYFTNGSEYVSTSSAWNTGRRAVSGTVPRGVYTGLDILEPLFRSVFNNQATMPKAYLVARAMTLMDPIFPYEQQDGRAVLCHVCNTDRPVEDTTRREYAMPGPGSSPKTNIYLRSFVALFYTAELESTDTSTRSSERIRMRKTPELEADLRRASELLAKLYNIRENRETFLESDKTFTAYGGRLCGENKTKSYPFEYRNAELVENMQKVVIAPMLEYQRQHNKAVTDILKKMFIKTGDSLKLSAELEADLNTETDRNLQVYCAAIRNLLLNYYLKAEAFFIMGVLMLEKYKRYTSLEL
jgi:hypothetical protein